MVQIQTKSEKYVILLRLGNIKPQELIKICKL